MRILRGTRGMRVQRLQRLLGGAAPRALRRHVPLGVGLSLGAGVILGGCKDLTGNQQLPAGTVNPSFYRTPAGAIGQRASAIALLQTTLPQHVTYTGLLSDELESRTIGLSPSVTVGHALTLEDAVNARLLPDEHYGNPGSATDQDYITLQTARANLGQARAAIAAYDTGAKAIGDPKVLRAEMFALEGYTEILLADFYCSGVPLSTLDFSGDFTYHAGSTTAQVYQDALAKEDSALALADTSTQVQYLARVLKGRALLDLGGATNVAAAAQVVASVPDGFQYRLAVNFYGVSGVSNTNLLNTVATVADTEGRNGLPYLTGGDPRTATTVTFQTGESFIGISLGSTNISNAVPLTVPTKYATTGFTPFVVASAVEARLIEAEAALQAGSGSWLTTLNTLRSVMAPPDTLLDTLGVTHCGGNFGTCGSGPGGNDPSMGQPSGGFAPAGYSVVAADTVYPAPAGIQSYCNNYSWYNPCWSGDTMVVLIYVRPAGVTAGTGGVAGLAPLSDPGASSPNPDSARVALLFRERAYWLFATGERQGDLRRLLRQYAQWFRRQDQVYPTGPYRGVGTLVYGTDVTAPIPGSEYLNPLFHGCLDRNP